MSNDLNAAVAEVGDVDALAEVAGEAVDLDALLQEGGEGGGVEDAVVHGLGGVDDELKSGQVSDYWSRGATSMRHLWKLVHTFLVIFWLFLGAPLFPPPPAVGFFCTRSQYTTLKPAAHVYAISFFLRAPSGHSRRRSGAAKRDTYRSLHHFVGIEVSWGGACRDRGRKEMGILRRAGPEGTEVRLAAEGRVGVGAEMGNLGALAAGESGREGACRSLFWEARGRVNLEGIGSDNNSNGSRVQLSSRSSACTINTLLLSRFVWFAYMSIFA